MNIELTVELINAIIIGNAIAIALSGILIVLSKEMLQYFGMIIFLICLTVIPIQLYRWAKMTSPELHQHYLEKGQYFLLGIVLVIAFALIYKQFKNSKRLK